MPLFRLSLLSLLVLLIAGCSEVPKGNTGPFYTPNNVKAIAKIPADVRRVIVLPVAGGPALTEETLVMIDSVCQTELSRTARFEVVPISRNTLAAMAGVRQISSVEKLPTVLIDKLFNIYNSYGADAILLIDVTAYSPYPPLLIGLRAKLARVTDGEIIWAADNIFSAAEPEVANAARHHIETLGSDHGRSDLSHTILQNPRRFAGYAAAATFRTLPPR